MLDYVRKRKSGEIKSNVAEGADLLTLFLANGEVFTDTFIVDELLDFFLAGVQTTQFATQTMLTHFSKSKDSMKRVREEFQ